MNFYRVLLITSFSLLFSAFTVAENFNIKSKSSSFTELKDTYLSIHNQAIAKNNKIYIEGDVLEQHIDKKNNNDTLLIDVKGSPAKVVLTNELGQIITIIASHIIYDVPTQIVTATNEASISWDSSYIKGHFLTYKLDGNHQYSCTSDPDDENSICESNYSTTDFSQ
ncbi:MAG: hypothetical protein HRU38_13435 [Saccharospirillaceae bacterium]|nr:hypothetical protein [Pseudomonadales bacterium]NRB79647.1 hypothetical protein [Saccharospirillaceae bacterium]